MAPAFTPGMRNERTQHQVDMARRRRRSDLQRQDDKACLGKLMRQRAPVREISPPKIKIAGAGCETADLIKFAAGSSSGHQARATRRSSESPDGAGGKTRARGQRGESETRYPAVSSRYQHIVPSALKYEICRPRGKCSGTIGGW